MVDHRRRVQRAIADVAIGVNSTAAGSFLLGHIQKVTEERDTLTRYLQHAVRWAPEKELDALAGITRAKFGEDVDLQMALFKSVQDGTAQRGSKLSEAARAWGAELAEKLLASAPKVVPDGAAKPVARRSGVKHEGEIPLPPDLKLHV